jgi:hypothetical protein
VKVSSGSACSPSTPFLLLFHSLVLPQKTQGCKCCPGLPASRIYYYGVALPLKGNFEKLNKRKKNYRTIMTNCQVRKKKVGQDVI